MAERPERGSTWRYRGLDQNGNEIGSREFGSPADALDWFRQQLGGETNEIRISRSSGDTSQAYPGSEEYVTTLRRDDTTD